MADNTKRLGGINFGELSNPSDIDTESLYKAETTKGSGFTKSLGDISYLNVSPSEGSPQIDNEDKGSFTRSAESGFESLLSAGNYFLAAAGQTIGAEDYAQDKIKDAEERKAKAESLMEGLITDINQVEDIGDLSDYLINGVGQAAPFAAEAVASALAGAAIGAATGGGIGLAGGAIAGGAARIAGKKTLQVLIKDYVKNQGYKSIIKTGGKQAVLAARKKAIVDTAIKKFYAGLGAAGASYIEGTGEITGEALDAGATTDQASKVGLLAGLPFAALDVLLPANIISKIGSKGAGGIFSRAARGFVGGAPLEGLTETAQEEILLRVKDFYDKDFDIYGDEAYNRRLNSFILGGFVGGGLGAIGGAVSQTSTEKGDVVTPITNTPFSNKELEGQYRRVESLYNTYNKYLARKADKPSSDDIKHINKVLGIVNSDLSKVKKDLEVKFLSEENSDTLSKAHAAEIIKVIDSFNSERTIAEDKIRKSIDDEQSVAEPKIYNESYSDEDLISAQIKGVAAASDTNLTDDEVTLLTKRVKQRLLSLENQDLSLNTQITALKDIIAQDFVSLKQNPEDFKTLIEAINDANSPDLKESLDLDELESAIGVKPTEAVPVREEILPDAVKNEITTQQQQDLANNADRTKIEQQTQNQAAQETAVEAPRATETQRGEDVGGLPEQPQRKIRSENGGDSAVSGVGKLNPNTGNLWQSEVRKFSKEEYVSRVETGDIGVKSHYRGNDVDTRKLLSGINNSNKEDRLELIRKIAVYNYDYASSDQAVEDERIERQLVAREKASEISQAEEDIDEAIAKREELEDQKDADSFAIREENILDRQVEELSNFIDRLREQNIASQKPLPSIEPIVKETSSSNKKVAVKTSKDSTESFMFVGPKASGINLNSLDKALDQFSQIKGKPTLGQLENIRQTTGWSLGKDNKWRFEVSDRDMVLKPATFTGKFTSAFDELPLNYNPVKLKDIIDHPKLFELYPLLESIDFVKANFISGSAGWSASNQTMYVNPEKTENIRESIAHELQHIVQDIEGFNGGGSTEDFNIHNFKIASAFKKEERDKITNRYLPAISKEIDLAIDANQKSLAETKRKILLDYLGRLDSLTHAETKFFAYERIVGEIEARDTASRINLTEDERSVITPENIPGLDHRGGITTGVRGRSRFIKAFVNQEEALSESVRIVKYLTGKLKDTSDLSITIVNSLDQWNSLALTKLDQEQFGKTGGYALKTKDGHTTILLNSTNLKHPSSMINALVHELVGHYGMDKLFGDKYRDFKISMLSSSPALRKDILSLSKQWDLYLDIWNKRNPEVTLTKFNSFPFITKDGRSIRIPHEVAIRLADEYLAELSSIKTLTGEFKVNTSLRESFVKKVFKRILHFFRSLFGNNAELISEKDLVDAVANSLETLFHNPHEINLFSQLNEEDKLRLSDSIKRQRESLNLNNDSPISEIEREDSYLVTARVASEGAEAYSRILEEEIDAAAKTAENPVEFTTRTHKLLSGNYGKINQKAHVKYFNKLGRELKNNPIIQSFFSLGNLPYQHSYESIQNLSKGAIGKVEKQAKAIDKILSKHSKYQKREVYRLFTTLTPDVIEAKSNLLSLGLKPHEADIVIDAKQTIIDLGQEFVNLGMLDEATFESNKGSYLPRRYLKYLATSPGTGKRTSFLNYLKQDKNLDENTKALLGEIKDPSFLVAETIGMLGRDVAILQMFESIANISRSANTGWVLRGDALILFKDPNTGKIKKRSIDWTLNQIDLLEKIIYDHNHDTSGAFQLTDSQFRYVSELKVDLEKQVDEVEAKLLDSFKEEAAKSGLSNVDPNFFRDQHYVKMPKDKRFGKLRGLWVRKEIKKDLEDVISSFQADPEDLVTKFFGDRGYLVKANSYWKLFKVPFNPPSWVRNGIGNFVLLDMSTTTNSGKLAAIIGQEFWNAINKKESKYWRWALDNGLFGTTYSANELYALQRDFNKRIKDIETADKFFHKSKLSAVFPWMNNKFLAAADFASRLFGNVEGLFKTASLRDYIETWEKENNQKIDDLIRSGKSNEAQAIISEGVIHANKSLFDYSRVPSGVNFLRRYPLGAPFITFMYKSLPITIESLAKRPQKFVKYIALPFLMTQLAMSFNDWTDDDIEKLKARMPEWTRDRGSVFLFPWKDSQGRPQFVDLEYAFPWAPFVNAGVKFTNHMDQEGVIPAFYSSVSQGSEIVDDFGFLGGPLPQIITAWKGGINSFTGGRISNPGDHPNKQLADIMTYTWNLMMPSFITSHGFLGKLYDDLGIDLPGFSPPTPLDRYGEERNTSGQVGASLFGFQTKSFNPQNSYRSNVRNFHRKLREIDSAKMAYLRDPNSRLDPLDRARRLREYNTRRKVIQRELREYSEQAR